MNNARNSTRVYYGCQSVKLKVTWMWLLVIEDNLIVILQCTRVCVYSDRCMLYEMHRNGTKYVRIFTRVQSIAHDLKQESFDLRIWWLWSAYGIFYLLHSKLYHFAVNMGRIILRQFLFRYLGYKWHMQIC